MLIRNLRMESTKNFTLKSFLKSLGYTNTHTNIHMHKISLATRFNPYFGLMDCFVLFC